MEKLAEKVKGDYYSVRNIKWRLKEVDEILQDIIRHKFTLPEIIARLLVSRGIKIEEIPDYLAPTIKSYLPDPLKLTDMEIAASFLGNAIINKRKIVIFGDYDVDGATSSAVLYRFFKEVGSEVGIYIPDRINEGYGPNINAFTLLKDQGYEIIITVDCGIAAFEQMEFAKELGLEVVIVDHHLPITYELPKAVAIVNPNRLDDQSGYNYLAAVGVCFLVCVAIRSYLIKQNFLNKETAFNLLELLDLVALGTVCDVVPLIGLNRAFIVQGLKIINQGKNKGISALIDIASIKECINVYHLGFLIGPRVNAGGRVGKSNYGSQLLTTSCHQEAARLSCELNLYNLERKTIEEFVLEEAFIQAEVKNKDNLVLVLAGEGWHPGVIGIVAGRIKESYNKPVAVISLNNGIGKASCRSVRYFDFGNSILKAKEQGLVQAGGGHKMAAGFTLHTDHLPELERFLNIAYSEQILNYEDYGVNYFDGYLSCGGININLIEKLAILGPFGAGNPEPKFMIKNCNLVNLQIMKEKHIAATIGGVDNGDNNMFRATCFNSVGTILGDNLLNLRGKNFDLLGTVKQNNWQDKKRAEFQIIDLVVSPGY
jgi:single-stranded-DNA-specific exonuclease